MAEQNKTEARRCQSTSGVLTTLLYNGETVLAKSYKGHLFAKTFANRAQAEKAAAAAEGFVVQRGRPFYVKVQP